MRNPRSSFAVVVALVAAACSAPVAGPTASVSDATAAQCAHGGKVLVVDAVEHVICAGAPGKDGTAPEIVVTDASTEQCAHGGQVVTVGEAVKVICNGAPGTDGVDGTDGLAVVVRQSEASTEECAQGGTRIEFGLDADADGTLGDTEEVLSSTVVCNGEAGAAGHGPTVTVTAATGEQCPHGRGGIVVTVDGADRVFCTPPVTRAKDLPLGAVVYDDSTTWNDGTLEWRVVHKDYAGLAGSATLQTVRDVANRGVYDGGWANGWDGATLRTWLNGTFADELSPWFADVVVTTDVQWARANAGGVGGTTQDRVFIASRTELGGPSLAGEGLVFSWFAAAETAPARRAQVAGTAPYWTRTGEQTGWEGGLYDMTLYYVTDTGAFAAGSWSSDGLGVRPVVNVRGDAVFLDQPDGRYKLWVDVQ